jgi:hypothetical protein
MMNMMVRDSEPTIAMSECCWDGAPAPHTSAGHICLSVTIEIAHHNLGTMASRP